MKAAIGTAICIWAAAAAASPQPFDPLWGRPIVIDPSKPPQNESIIHLFLLNASTPLKGTGCVHEGADDKLALREELALMLSQAVGTPQGHKAFITAECKPDKTDALAGRVTDVWACSINVEHVDERGDYVSNGAVRAHFTRDTWTMIPSSLLCN